MLFGDSFRGDRANENRISEGKQLRSQINWGANRFGNVAPGPVFLLWTEIPGYLQSILLSWAAAICHLPLRFSQVSVQIWHTFASGWVLSLPMACSLP